MKIIIQTPDFKATKKLEKYTTRQLGKLMVMKNEIIEARVCLKLSKSDSKENKIAEIKLVIPGNDLFAEKQSETFEESILKSVTALKHQIHRVKTFRERQRAIQG